MRNIRYPIAAVIAGTLTVAGCTSAVATSTAAPAKVAASGTAGAIASKPAAPPVLTHLTVYSVNSDAPVFASVISGPTVGDHGSADQVSAGGKVPTKHGGELLLSLARGTFRLNIADIGAKFTKALGPATIPSTCSDYVSVRDNASIVPGSGTGAYRGIAGTFDVTLTVNELHPSPCTPTSRLFRQLIWFDGAGTITLAR